ncbi:alpha/beta-Hydrolase [Glarea lozoyensis ATCC 20868]|uniref:Alpha/beta-Hydrolase n=1 Tax=Glarea lozoyensis (strain ATCC 20868 / MF5171) TaxID=1116229 RepID=S3DA45_GLAL2|nr:alpha/beta-Hydrolase [Glarea lozoyensis ATCC 20868]EPE28831.1 alpha/beta-Hydrolase [Glarea lozoyensis ATCC 20868]
MSRMSASEDKHIPVTIVSIDSGQLSGLQFPNNTLAFLGIPYAAPPISSLRWRPPQRPLPWTGVRSAVNFGPSAVHFPPPPRSLYFGGETDFNEDCLYLNVWTGSNCEGKRPVLLWFHMGAFQFGSGSNPLYDGRKLAEEGITVVTVNYRLGRFGFLAHSELTAESEYQAKLWYHGPNCCAGVGTAEYSVLWGRPK